MFTLSTLDPLIADRSLLKHPFYQKWSKGELTLDDLKIYAREYYHLVERVPGMVSRVRASADGDSVLPAAIDVNIREETEHIALWETFATSLGITSDELTGHEPSRMVRHAVKSLEDTCARGLDEGVAAMYALEREIPAIARTKQQGLREFYGLSSDDAHAYFNQHLHEDKHLAVWLSVPVDRDRATAAARTSIEAQNEVLDGVCAACGIQS